MAPQPLWVVTGPQTVLALGGLDSFEEGVAQSVLPAASCHPSGLHVPGVRSHHTDTTFMSPGWVHLSGALPLCSWEGPSAQPALKDWGVKPPLLDRELLPVFGICLLGRPVSAPSLTYWVMYTRQTDSMGVCFILGLYCDVTS